MGNIRRVGVIGATSPVGQQVLQRLLNEGAQVVALSRSRQNASNTGVTWVKVSDSEPMSELAGRVGTISEWIVVAHIWVIPAFSDMFRRCQAARLVCISSTSRFTKKGSASAYEEDLAERLAQGEHWVQGWCEENGVAWTVLRPTLIYGRSTDRNLSEIVRLIRKWRFFPLFGGGKGKRQPIYVDDVADACVKAWVAERAYDKAYNISGGEVLTYKEMVARIYVAMGMSPRFISVPLPLFKLALTALKLIPRYRNWNADMVTRMGHDMVFDHQQATRDFSFQPRPFHLSDVDVN